MATKKQRDAEWEPTPTEPYVHETGPDGLDVLGRVHFCYRHTDQSAPHPGRRDNLTRWTCSTDIVASAWLRWDFVRNGWVRALGQRDGAPVVPTNGGADAEIPSAIVTEQAGEVAA